MSVHSVKPSPNLAPQALIGSILICAARDLPLGGKYEQQIPFDRNTLRTVEGSPDGQRITVPAGILKKSGLNSVAIPALTCSIRGGRAL